MSETFKIVLTSSLTIIGGVIIYAVSQFLSKFIIEPIHEQRKVIGEIADALVYYANIYSNPGIPLNAQKDEASKRFRQLATLLQSKTHMIPSYHLFEKIRVVQKSSNIAEASGELIGLSNSMYPPRENDVINYGLQNIRRRDQIKKLLDLKII